MKKEVTKTLCPEELMNVNGGFVGQTIKKIAKELYKLMPYRELSVQ